MRRDFGIAVLTLCCVLGISTTAGAVDLPCRNVKMIVPASAGGPTDLQSRIIADAANKMGAKPTLQAFNMGAQGGAEAGMALRDAKPDGCTLMFAHWNPMLLYMTGRLDINYSHYEPIALMTDQVRVLGTSTKTPYKNLQELVAYVKANGPESVIAGATLGATSHFQILLFEKAAGIKVKTVSYNHTRERMTALLANNIQLSELGALEAGGYIKSGQMRVLGVFAASRSPILPEVPTALEQGYDVQFAISHGFYAPKGTPKDVIDHYVQLFGKVANDPAFKKTMQDKDVYVNFKAPAEYKKFLDANYETLKKLAIEVGVYKR